MRPVQAASLFLVIGAGHHDLIILNLYVDQRMNGGIQGALGALYADVVAVNFDLNTGRDDDGFSSNSRHCLYPFLTTQRRALRRQRAQHAQPCRS